jgi:hypothetical protein
MDEEFYAVVKLKNGEELFSLVCPSFENDKEILILYYPITITPVKTRNGIEYLVQPWIKIGNESMFILFKEDILTLSELNDPYLTDMHKSYSGSKEETRIYNGLVSNVKEQLERIYKKS